jgi:hypothetical protein
MTRLFVAAGRIASELNSDGSKLFFFSSKMRKWVLLSTALE